MSGFPGRNGRRRRVLNQEAAGAQPTFALGTEDAETAAYAPRYSEAAGVEHHAQVTDFVPRRYRTFAALGLCGVLTVAACAMLDIGSRMLDSAHPTSSIQLPTFSIQHLASSLANWMSSVLLMVAGITCLLIHSLRRHRIDDIRGRYRVWRWAAVACFVMSATSVAVLHAVLADLLTHATGWTALRGGAVWWLVVGGLPLAWIATRALWDARECRLAASLSLVAASCYAVAVASHLGVLTIGDPRLEPPVILGTRLLGHWALLLGIVGYARYVVLDAQGLISNTRRVDEPSSGSPAAETLASGRSTVPLPGATQWIDGSRPEPQEYGDDDEHIDGRKLTKAERKRLRKLKAQHRAA